MRPFEYCRPILAKAVPTEADWIHEVKYDGYRGRVVRSGNEVKVLSKSGLSAKREFFGNGPETFCEVVNSRKLRDWAAGVARYRTSEFQLRDRHHGRGRRIRNEVPHSP